MPGKREIIRPGWDGVIVTLDTDPAGIQREGKSGVDYQYVINSDSGIMWLPRSGRDAILQSGARKGDQIEICQSKRSGYVATVVSDAKEEPQRRPPVPAPSAPAPAPAPAPAIQESHPVEDMSKRAMEAAARVTKHVEAYCQQIGLPVEASFEDVRALAIHWLIGREKSGRQQ